MCEDSEILKLQAEMEFERGNFNRLINDMTAQNKFMYSDNMKLKLKLKLKLIRSYFELKKILRK